MSEQDVTDLKRLISENKSEALEQKKERRQEFAQLADLIKNLTLSQTQNNEQTKESIGIVTHRLEKIEERVEKVEKGGAAMGGDRETQNPDRKCKIRHKSSGNAREGNGNTL